MPLHEFVHAGISKSFQITNIFPRLTTHENVRLAAQATVAGKNFWSKRARLVETDERARSLLDEVGLGNSGQRVAAELAISEAAAFSSSQRR